MPYDPPSLIISTPVLYGQEPVLDLSHIARGWKRVFRLDGGCWLGSFSLEPGDGGMGLSDLKNIFHEFCGYHLGEKAAGMSSWGGMLYEMDLSIDGHTKRRSLEGVKNRIKAIYTNTSDETAETSWYEHAGSQAKYGKMEDILKLDGYGVTQAQTRVQTELKRNALPYPTGAGFDMRGGTWLTAQVAGYALTCNHRYVTATADADVNASTWVDDIVDTDCTFVSAGRISTNTLQVWKNNKIPQRAWDNLLNIAELGDASYNPWRVWVDQDRRLHYEQVSTDYQYIVERSGEEWRIYGAAGDAINPWLVRPGVIRDMSYPGSAEPGSPLLPDIRDELIEEVEVSNGTVYLKPSGASEIDILVAQQEYMEEFEDERTEAAKKSRRKKKRNK